MLNFIKGAVALADRRHRFMRDYRTIGAMDDRMLRDIGVTRAEIDAAQRQVRWMV